MIRCPKCRSSELHVHGTRVRVEWRPRFGWFGRMATRAQVVGLDLSCGDCYFAFVSRPDGLEDAPLQTAWKGRVVPEANGPALSAVNDEEKPAPRQVARPAPDPRVRRR